jgi:predicted ATP-grasp superfamily ATP-dependent carboligase
MKKTAYHDRPPAIVLGGTANALSIVRSLGRAGVECYAINYPQVEVKYSRFCKWIDIPNGPGTVEETWAAYLLGHESNHLGGAVLFAACDEAIELIAKHRQALSEKFRLDLSNTKAQLCMLNKLCTYQAAERAGVPTPKFWVPDTREQIEKLKDELIFPLILKPFLTHQHKAKFGGARFFCVQTFNELLDAFDATSRAGIKTFLVEMILGRDDKLCSYYTYLDENGNNLFDYTKRIIRRFPATVGTGIYHITDYVPELKEPSLKLFREVGLQGIANAEFKLDERDSQLKLIECNARFTAADCLLTASGLNLSLFVYDRLTGHPQAAPRCFRSGMRLWYAGQDFLAYRQLHKMGLLSFWQWVRSILKPQIFPFFRWNDPLPSIVRPPAISLRRIRARLSGKAKQVMTSLFPPTKAFFEERK